jgi:hypothetical protein
VLKRSIINSIRRVGDAKQRRNLLEVDAAFPHEYSESEGNADGERCMTLLFVSLQR